MCIVVDTNVVGSVFNPASANHEEFKPVFDWILRGKGKLVYGGRTYAREVFARMRRYAGVIDRLKKKGKCVVLDHDEVDAVEQRVRDAEPSADFDDAHLVAIFDVSGCMLLCSDDARADRFVKDRGLYERRTPPRIYRLAKHARLLCDDNIAACCKPAEQLAGPARAEILGTLDHE